MRLRYTKTLGALLAVAFVTGCATESSSTSVDVNEFNNQKQVIESQQYTITDLERRIQQQERELAAARATSTERSAGMASASSMSSELFPPDAKPGRCYARILTPAVFRTSEETVLAKEASQRIEVVPAEFETVTERVLVKEASTRLEIVPATYRTVTERVLVKPESVRFEEVPATYREESERVLVTPARTEWKRGPANSFSASGSVLDSRTTDTGEIMCLVEIPAVYKTVTRRVLATPATTREVAIPAEYRTVEKQVVAQPATTREVVIPAVYDTVEVTRQVRPASERRIDIPAEYTTVTRREKVSEEILDWREVVCEVNLDRANVSTLQTELKDAGYYRGPVDGIIGPMTLSAANSYASSKGLPVGTNYIAVETIKSLGLVF